MSKQHARMPTAPDSSEQFGQPEMEKAGAEGNSFALDVAGFKGNSSAFPSDAASPLGVDTSTLNIVAGQRGDAEAKSHGGIATSVGSEVFLSDSFGELSQEEQEHVLTHELVHRAQQTAGGDGAADPEADAERMASAVGAGASSVQPLASVSPSSANNFSPGDLANAAWEWGSDVVEEGTEWVEDVIDDVTQWGVDQITDLQALLTYIDSVGETAGKTILQELGPLKPAILVAFFLASPTSALALYGLGWVPKSEVRDAIDQLDEMTLGDALNIALTLALLGPITPVLLDIDARKLAAALKNLDPSRVLQIVDKLGTAFVSTLKEMMVTLWPEGLGVGLAPEISATFGYPVKLGAGLVGEVAHVGDGVLKLHRAGELLEALDTGAGAGAFVGLEGKNGEGGLGIGAEAGVGVEAGLKQIVDQVFEFPIFEDAAFITFVISCVGVDNFVNVVEIFGGELGSLYSMNYNKSTRFEAKMYAEGSGQAGAGVRTGDGDTTDGSFSWSDDPANGTRGPGDQNTGKATEFWQIISGIEGQVRAAGDASVWVEIRIDSTKEVDGVPTPDEGTIEIGGAVHALASATSDCALLPTISLMDHLPVNAVEGQMGAKILYKCQNNTDGSPSFLEWITDPTFEYFIMGKADEFSGTMSVALEDDIVPLTDTVNDVINKLNGGSLEIGVGLASQLGSKYTQLMAEKAELASMFGEKDQSAALIVEGGLKFKGEIEKKTMQSVARSLVAASNRYDGDDGAQLLWNDMLALVGSGTPPPDIHQAISTFVNDFSKAKSTFDFSGKIGIKAAAKAGAAEGGKVEADLGLAAYLTYERDLFELLGSGDTLTSSEMNNMLLGQSISGGDSVEVPTT